MQFNEEPENDGAAETNKEGAARGTNKEGHSGQPRDEDEVELSEDERARIREEFGLPLSPTWERVEQVMRVSKEEEKENARLGALRIERLQKRPGQLSDEEKKNPEDAMFSLGTARVWTVRQEMTSEYRERDAASEQRLYAEDCAAHGAAEAEVREAEREGILNAQQWRKEPPLWQQISGLFPDVEQGLHPNERAAGIRALLKRAERWIRWEIRKEEAGRAERKEGGRQNAEGGTEENAGNFVGAESPDNLVDSTRRSAQWDPLREICFYLGIAQRKLSALCREINGLAVTQLCDAVRAELLWKKLKKRVGEWVAATTETEKRGEAGNLKDRAFELWRRLKGERQKAGAHRSSYAWNVGFSSYTRLFRACLVCYGLTPQEIELRLIEESLGEGALCVCGQGGADRVVEGAEAQRRDEKPAEAG